MANELPHAALRCTACGTGFSVKLKKGRIPTKPIPCPRCRAPVTVTEADIVDPGAKPGGAAVVPSILEKTKLVAVDEGELLAAAAAAAAAEEPLTRDELELDPPAAEAPAAASSAAAKREAPTSHTAAFGIVNRKRIGAPKGPKDTSDGLGLTVGTPGVHVVRGEGRGKRDNVFGGRTSNSFAIGRINTKRVAASEVTGSRRPIADDPDLPAPVVSDEEEIRFLDVSSEPSEAFLEVAPEPIEPSEQLPELEPEPVSEASEGLLELEPEPVSEASEGLLELEPEPVSEASEGLLELEPEPLDADLPAPKADLPAAKLGLPVPKAGLPSAKVGLPAAKADLPAGDADLPSAKADLPSPRAGLPAPARPGIPSPRLDLSRLKEAAAKKQPSGIPDKFPVAKVEAGSGRARLPSLFDLELPLDEIANEASDAIQAGLDARSAPVLDISFDPIAEGAAAPAGREAFDDDLALEMEDSRAQDASLVTVPTPAEPVRASLIEEDATVLAPAPQDETLLVDAGSVASQDHPPSLDDVNIPWRDDEFDELPEPLPPPPVDAFGDLPEPLPPPPLDEGLALRTNLSDDATRMNAPEDFPQLPVAAKKSNAPVVIVVVLVVVLIVVVAALALS